MRLTVDECIQRIKEPRNQSFLQAARLQEERLLMHCEPILDERPAMNAIRAWKQWVQSFLPADKFKRFEQLLRFPLKTVNDTSVIWDELSKIFDAPDKSLRLEFTVPEMETDFWQYAEDQLNDENFWQETGWQALKTKINSFIVVDLPRQQREARPEPYYYLLSCSAVHDVEINPITKRVEYILIKQAKRGKDEVMLAIDDNAYRIFYRPESSDQWFLMADGEARHSWYNELTGHLVDGLGYAPVCPFWEHSVEGSGGINKNGPLTTSLSDLDWLLFWDISKKYMDLYGAWPIVVRYKEDCTYENEFNATCDNGRLKYDRPDPGTETGWRQCNDPCPVCAKNSILGPGSELAIEPPKTAQEADLMNDHVKFVEMSNDKLVFGVEELERLERKIQINATGRLLHEATKEAINEDQVRSQYEAQQAKMNIIRKQFESNRQFVLTTTARLRYGRYFIRGSVFFGKEYFLQSANDLSNQYATAKKNGLPEYEVDRIREAYSNTKYKSDDMQRQRARILAELYPYPNMTVTECKMAGVEMSDPDGYKIKLNFSTFIKRFERENINIVEFGSLLPFSRKIDIIHQKLLEYANAIKPAPSPQIDSRADAGA